MPENSGSAYARDVRCLRPNLKDDGNRKGFALCVQHLTDYIASQMDEKKSHD